MAPHPPEPVQGMATGLWGALVVLGGALVFAAMSSAGYAPAWFPHRYALLLTAAFIVMAGRELVVTRVHERNFDFSRARPLEGGGWARVLRRWGALATTLALATGAYTVLTHYGLDLGGARLLRWQGWYAPFFSWYVPLAGAFLLLGLPYAILAERHGRWSPEEDELLSTAAGYGALARMRRPPEAFWAAQRSFLVKFFFLPIMVVFLAANATVFEGAVGDLILSPASSPLDRDLQALAFTAAYHGLYLLDVALAVLGYVFALRLLDTHVRSADPTLGGWVVALACYPPFAQVTDLYLGYGMGEHSWSATFQGNGVLLVLVGAVILALTGVYALATVAFGLRFSNMTHRGILTRGPYAWVRHPAYAAKTLAWWVASAPFLHGPGDTVRLALWTSIYVGRALTEERHLMADPRYREYATRVRWRFIPGVW